MRKNFKEEWKASKYSDSSVMITLTFLLPRIGKDSVVFASQHAIHFFFCRSNKLPQT